MTDSLGIHRISDIIFLSRQPFYALCGLTAPFENRSGTSYRGKTRVSHLANKQIKAN
jgi:transposase